MIYDNPITTTLKIDGVEVPAGLDDIRAGTPTVLDDLTFSWGRSSNVDQPELGSASFTIREQLNAGTAAVPMMDIVAEDSTVEVWVDITYPATEETPAHTDTKLIWAGTVQSVNGRIASDQAIEIKITAVGYAAPLADETIGDEPWPVQSAATRANRILELATTDTAPISIDSALAGLRLSYKDVDSQPPLGLLQDIAQGVGGVLWQTTLALGRQVGQHVHWIPQTYLWIEDPRRRPSLRIFVIDRDTKVVSIADSTAETMLISAADVLRDPVEWTRDKTQEINSVDVGWQEQAVDEDGRPSPIARTVTVTKDPRPVIIKKLSVDTDLVDRFDATTVANRYLALASGPDWVASGITIDTRLLARDLFDFEFVYRLDVIATLLDGLDRLGRAITIVDLPTWAPGGESASMFVEGGTYTLTNGAWVLDLDVTAASGVGDSATFADFGGTGATIADFEPSIQIRDAFGVSGPNAFGDGFGAGPFGEQPFGT